MTSLRDHPQPLAPRKARAADRRSEPRHASIAGAGTVALICRNLPAWGAPGAYYVLTGDTHLPEPRFRRPPLVSCRGPARPAPEPGALVSRLAPYRGTPMSALRRAAATLLLSLAPTVSLAQAPAPVFSQPLTAREAQRFETDNAAIIRPDPRSGADLRREAARQLAAGEARDAVKTLRIAVVSHPKDWDPGWRSPRRSAPSISTRRRAPSGMTCR